MYFFDLFRIILVVLYFLLLFLCNDSYLILMVYLELDVLSDDRVMMYLFVIFFFGVIMIFGIFGNFLVLYIYCFDFKWKLVNNFIIIMVLFDFLVCGIVILLDIYDMCFYYIFFNFVVCKVFWYFEFVFINVLLFILILIVIDRYLKICKFFLFEFLNWSKFMCIVVIVFGFVIVVLICLLFGIKCK